MKTKEITLCGKQVTLAYCFATEIAFKKFTGDNIDSFEPSNPEHVIFIILSAIVSFYQQKDEEAPIQDKDLLYNTKPAELVTALTEVMQLRAAWYEIPKGDNTDATVSEASASENEKNA